MCFILVCDQDKNGLNGKRDFCSKFQMSGYPLGREVGAKNFPSEE